jgi:hypothetical protein
MFEFNFIELGDLKLPALNPLELKKLQINKMEKQL